MPPLGKVAIGLLLVIVDFRIESFDLVPDVVGWLLVLAGLVPLSRRSGGFGAATLAAGLGLLVALVGLVAEPGPAFAALGGLTETVVVFGVCTGVMALVAEPSVQRTANRIRWADLAITLVGTGGILAIDGAGTLDGAEGLLLVLVPVALAVVVWFLVFVWSLRDRPELVPGPGTADGLEPGTP